MSGYISPADEHFPVHCSTIEQLAESGAQKVARERAALVRADGSAMFAPAEHAERDAAILEAAGAAYDRSTRQFLSLADTEQAKAEAEPDLATASGLSLTFGEPGSQETCGAASRACSHSRGCSTRPPRRLHTCR